MTMFPTPAPYPGWTRKRYGKNDLLLSISKAKNGFVVELEPSDSEDDLEDLDPNIQKYVFTKPTDLLTFLTSHLSAIKFPDQV